MSKATWTMHGVEVDFTVSVTIPHCFSSAAHLKALSEHLEKAVQDFADNDLPALKCFTLGAAPSPPEDE